jgi:hypothetical protein
MNATRQGLEQGTKARIHYQRDQMRARCRQSLCEATIPFESEGDPVRAAVLEAGATEPTLPTTDVGMHADQRSIGQSPDDLVPGNTWRIGSPGGELAIRGAHRGRLHGDQLLIFRRLRLRELHDLHDSGI